MKFDEYDLGTYVWNNIDNAVYRDLLIDFPNKRCFETVIFVTELLHDNAIIPKETRFMFINF